MSGNWLDVSSTSGNRFLSTYVKGFVDVSGGNVLLRAGPTNNNHLILQGGDISLNGRLNVATGTSVSVYKNFYGKVPPTTSATSTYALPIFSPNSMNATPNTWTNSGVTWTSSASSIYNNSQNVASFKVFNTIPDDWWGDDGASYTSSTGVATSAYQTTVYTTGSSGATSTYNGSWIQIQSSEGLSMKTFYFFAREGVVYPNAYCTRLPQVFYIVGSNTGTGTWTPIFKGDTASTTGSATSATVSLNGLASSGTISNFYGSTSLTYTTYGNLTTSFTYFRLIVSEICGADVACNMGEWGITFTSFSTAPTGPSRALIYMDASNINQVDVSGSLGLINSSPTSIIVTPNTTVATPTATTTNSKPWLNNNITWDASASSVISPTGAAGAFNMSYLTSAGSNYPWESAGNYNSTTGVYTGSVPTTVSGSTINGEWLQIQSSVPLVLKNYYLLSRGWTGSLVDRLPATYTIAGSNDGSTWFNLHDASFTASPVTNVSGTSSQITSVYQVSTATIGSTNSQNSNNNITGYTNQTNSYTYFRFIVKSGLQGKFGIAGEFSTTNFYWNPFFTPAASSVSLALDNTTPNQLNIGGSLGISNNVGIGTTSPQSLLHVEANSNGSPGIVYKGIASDNGAKSFLSLTGTSSSIPWCNGGTSTLYFYTNGGGTIYRYMVTGSTYFTGQHANLPVNIELKTNIKNYIGLLVSSADQGYYSVNQATNEITTGSAAITITEALPKINLTTTDKDPAVWGVITNVKNDDINTDGTIPTDDEPQFGDRMKGDMIRINGLGEGALWVTNINGDINNGDLLCSSIIPGYGRKQDDDLFHNYTAAKATMSCNFDMDNNDLYLCKEIDFNGTTYKAAFIGVSYHCS